MKFPQGLVHFLYSVFFKPISLYTSIDQFDPSLNTAAALLMTHSRHRSIRSLRNLALVYVLIVPWLLGLGTGLILSKLGLDVNWLKLIFTLFIGMPLSLTFSIPFCIAFLLPFSLIVAIWSSTSLTLSLGILFSLMLGLAYSLSAGSAKWGLTAGLVYSIFLSLVLGPIGGLAIGAAFLAGYFRIIFYLVEAPLSWGLAILAARGEALELWQWHPVLWDELIWFPLPWLNKHLLAIRQQNEQAAPAAILHVQRSFRQSWAAEWALEQEHNHPLMS